MSFSCHKRLLESSCGKKITILNPFYFLFSCFQHKLYRKFYFFMQYSTFVNSLKRGTVTTPGIRTFSLTDCLFPIIHF